MTKEELINKICLFPAHEASHNPECLFILGKRNRELNLDDMQNYLHNLERISKSFSDCILHFKHVKKLDEIESYVIRNSMYLFDKCMELLWRIDSETTDDFHIKILLESDFDGAENLPYDIQELITPIVPLEVTAVKNCIKMVEETDTKYIVLSDLLKAIFFGTGILAMEFYLRLDLSELN